MTDNTQEVTEEQMDRLKEFLTVNEDEGSMVIDMAELDIEDEDITAEDIAEHYLEQEGIHEVTVKNASEELEGPLQIDLTKSQSGMIEFDDWMKCGGWEMVDYETDLEPEVLNWYYKDTVGKEKKSDHPLDTYWISIKETERGELPVLLGKMDDSSHLAEILFEDIDDKHYYEYWYIMEGGEDLSPEDVKKQFKENHGYDELMISDQAIRDISHSRVVHAQAIDPSIHAILMGYSQEYLMWLNVADLWRLNIFKYHKSYWINEDADDNSLTDRENTPIIRTLNEHSELRGHGPNWSNLGTSAPDWPEESTSDNQPTYDIEDLWKYTDALNLGFKLMREFEEEGYPECSESVSEGMKDIVEKLHDRADNVSEMVDRVLGVYLDSDSEDED